MPSRVLIVVRMRSRGLIVHFYLLCAAAIVGLAAGRYLGESSDQLRMTFVVCLMLAPIVLVIWRDDLPKTVPPIILHGILVFCGMALIPILTQVVPLPSRDGDYLSIATGILLHVGTVLGIPAVLLGTILFLISRGSHVVAATPTKPSIATVRFITLQAIVLLFAVIGAILLCLALWLSRDVTTKVFFLSLLLGLGLLYSHTRRGLELMAWRFQSIGIPDSLRTALDTIRRTTGVQFDEVIVTNETSFMCRAQVVFSLLGTPRLVLSRRVLDALRDEELLALVCHESAHVKLSHYTRALRYRTATMAASVGLLALFSWLIGLLMPDSMAWLVVVIPLALITLPRYLWSLYVIRVLEAEADRYAATSAGGDALIGALHKLSLSSCSSTVRVPSMWTTHGTTKERESRIRGY